MTKTSIMTVQRETLYNPDFKVVEFDHFRKEAGLPTFTMSVNNCKSSPLDFIYSGKNSI